MRKKNLFYLFDTNINRAGSTYSSINQQFLTPTIPYGQNQNVKQTYYSKNLDSSKDMSMDEKNENHIDVCHNRLDSFYQYTDSDFKNIKTNFIVRLIAFMYVA